MGDERLQLSAIADSHGTLKRIGLEQFNSDLSDHRLVGFPPSYPTPSAIQTIPIHQDYEASQWLCCQGPETEDG